MSVTTPHRQSPTGATGPERGFESLERELRVERLPIRGTLPAWLAGTLLRNGPALFEDTERSVRHWFDGQAMLHRFTIAGGQVGYANRFLRTRSYRAIRERGRLSYSEFATDPCRSIFKRAMTLFDPQVTDNTLVSLTRLGTRHYAMTEGQMSVQFDPDTLETLGYSPKSPGTFATAHPHRDPASGALINMATRMGARNSYRFFGHEPEQRPRVIASKAVREPGYVHSFAMTERYLALTEFPFVVNPIQIPLSGRPFIENFRWEPDRGTRILVFDRHSGRGIGVFETDPGFAFHHVGAWDQGDELVMDYCDHETPAIIDELYLDKLRGASPGRQPRRAPARLRRVSIDLTTRRVHSQYRSDHDIELPRINERDCYLRPYRYVYGISTGPKATHAVADRLVKIDNDSGSAAVWSEDGSYPGEPVFVAAPTARSEDHGVALSVVLDAAHGRSYLLVLDAESWNELARIEAPHAIPHGIHGAFYPGQ
jgi:carotenoid cleavage dioxygenase-like enzyme